MSYQYSIILPTRNESENVPGILTRIKGFLDGKFSYEIIFVDDSTDHTPDVISALIRDCDNCRLIHREKAERTGLATALLLGGHEAQGEYVLCMDSDLQHPPETIPKLFTTIATAKCDVVVATRYKKGGSAKGLGGLYRRFVSIACKWISHLLLVPTRKTSDPGSGFFAFRRELIRDIELVPKGFKLLIELLVKVPTATVREVPFVFAAREGDESKASIQQGIAFLSHLLALCAHEPESGRFIRFSLVGISGIVVNLVSLYILVDIFSFSYRIGWFGAVSISIISNYILNSIFTFPELRNSKSSTVVKRFISFVILSAITSTLNYAAYSLLLKHNVYYIFAAAVGIVLSALFNYFLSKHIVWKKSEYILLLVVGIFALYQFVLLLSHLNRIETALIILSVCLSIQGFFSIFLMLYAWEDPDRIQFDKAPDEFKVPQYSFTALIPARHEENVISQTIQAVAAIEYPETLKEIIIICRSDDEKTIAMAERVIQKLNNPYVKMLVFDGFPINKPHGLNRGLLQANNDIVTIFDAEDQPHPSIYNVINTVLLRKNADIVQSGVQLMSYAHKWYSLFNVLEYFFWFKSSMHFFSKMGIIPLGGNTVFFKRELLKAVGGWDQECLTEDADIGIRLSLHGAKTVVVYDEIYATQEETPPTFASFIKQRTRWNQGFVQILLKGDWLRFKKPAQVLLSLYILIWPIVQGLLFVYLPFALIIAFTVKVPAYIALITNIPMYVFFFSLAINLVGAYEFCKAYKKQFYWWIPFQIVFLHLFYQLTLGLASFRALGRLVVRNRTWEKTEHINAHRVQVYE